MLIPAYAKGSSSRSPPLKDWTAVIWWVVLRTLLISRPSSLEQVAQLFSMNRRTLNRRLQKQNVTFQALVEEIRYEIARQLLENTRLSMCQIAAILDIATPALSAAQSAPGCQPTQRRQDRR